MVEINRHYESAPTSASDQDRRHYPEPGLPPKLNKSYTASNQAIFNIFLRHAHLPLSVYGNNITLNSLENKKLLKFPLYFNCGSSISLVLPHSQICLFIIKIII
ncbi:hypothetical protein EDEG_00483 [Edhazardia aedis USNM 41457]|uniref:Uncharacterized protein n=1 Tax=Edhazardia aedis (strain USNM 41457) TaxID=1003232 RepID=J8ZNQ8_EDHAE|nr:hypothetical protein EDEG_00483 [Edhazardia aedis USNM 41457]|eukprot:EJW01323.1 hypothetical protein EDEG_00483 [Edhazardia aedis USNM 41457]